jgi:hypothetical protein
MLKLLTQLNIFTCEHHNDRPCVYFFNPDSNTWSNYTTDTRTLKLVNRNSTESSIDSFPVDDVDSVAVVNSCVNDRLFDSYAPDDISLGEDYPSSPYSPTPQVWRGNGSERYWTTGPIYDEESGVWVQSQVECTGYTPQKVLVEAVKVVKGLTEKFLGNAAIAIDKVMDLLDVSAPPSKDSQEDWWKANRDKLGYADYAYNYLPVINGVVSVVVDGTHKPLAELMKEQRQLKRHLHAV